MEWGDLRIFLAAVRAGSYTAAGRQLGINRTTVGRRIDALEAALGVELFQYLPSGPWPTPDGERLLAVAENIEREISALQNGFSQAARRQGPIRIASSTGLAIEFLPDLDRFLREEPDVTIELLGEVDPVEAVTARRADVGIAVLRLPPKRLSGLQIGMLRQALYRRRGQATGRPLGWGHEVEHMLPGPGATANPAGEDAEHGGFPSFNSWPQLKEAVAAGMGSAMLWCFAADADPRLERMEAGEGYPEFPLWLVRRAKSPPAPGLQRLMTFLEASIAARLGG